ncbi:hypothetical protein A11A3_06405 [Alcanivorax hongdengensis A-11-3]|uniref:Uncharacterized protein n=1 Tax=Alcanivorax hongdengensis A-11-3 TaxID=1177179 RepID=L0WFA5_9GAMM|nr:hypothetical protein [Alcanivorax hongdengensis]EKF74842.1 hypothetical protein A11A3_06405 [Alcanivorax hongdengensis A-11-3]
MFVRHVIKDVLFLLVALAAMIALVHAIAADGQNLFAAMVVFAAMVPVVGSAAVALKRDWDSRDSLMH